MLTIVVPVLDGGDMLLHALERVEAERHELVLVDNGSTDGSVERARERFPHARVVTNPTNRGFARACNQGAAEASGRFLLFLNTDAFLDGACVDRLVSAAMADDAGAVWQPVNVDAEGRVDSAGDLFSSTGIFVHVVEPPVEGVHSVFATKGAAMLVRSDVFRALGGFREDYFAYFEESDFCWRARLAGWEVRVVADARVVHLGGATTARIFTPADVRYLSFRNRLRSVLSNPEAGTLVRMLPLHVAALLGFALVYLFTGRPSSAAAVVRALWWVAWHRDVWGEQRRSVQSARRLADVQVFRPEVRARLGPRTLWRHARHHLFLWEKTATRARASR